VRDSEISWNTAHDSGGGVGFSAIGANDAEVFAWSEIVNCTISGNKATYGGGVVFDTNEDVFDLRGKKYVLRHSTVAYNLAGFFPNDQGEEFIGHSSYGGGGIFVGAPELMHPDDDDYTVGVVIDHSIVANNAHHRDSFNISDDVFTHYAPDVGSWATILRDPFTFDGPVIYLDAKYSLIGDPTGPLLGGVPDNGFNPHILYKLTLLPTSAGTNRVGFDPQLGALFENGGPKLLDGSATRTHALDCDSPAVDAGYPALIAGSGTTPLYDQRGMRYTRIYDVPAIPNDPGPIDIGAFELGPQDLADFKADFNNDGKVDGADLEIWRNNFGRVGVTSETGDADGDGDVDDEDLRVWADQFGQGVDPGDIDADFNNDSDIDGSDFLIWQRHLGETGPLTNADGDADGDGDVDGTDFMIWQRELGSIADCQGYVRAWDVFRQFESGKILVSTLSDVDDGYYGLGEISLREAIYIASQNTGNDVIVFADQLRGGVIELASQLIVASNVDVIGPGASLLTIDANLASRVFNVSSGVTSRISGLTITGGGNVDSGGGVRSEGNLTLDSVVVSGNRTILNGTGTNHGGGVYSAGGSLYVKGSTIDGNQARWGGGLCVSLTGNSVLEIADSTISNNTGLNTVTAGEPDGLGGGLLLSTYGTVGTAQTTIANSTFSGNRSKEGAGLSLREDLSTVNTKVTIVNSTVTDNHTKSGSTYITGGYAGGIQAFSVTGTPDVTLHNTILAGNTAHNYNHHDVWGALQSASSHNIIGQAGSSGLTNNVNGNQVGTQSALIDPRLAPLADNGGAAKTHALLAGSPAADRGNNDRAAAFELDQRGESRIKDANLDGLLVADIGAYEAEADEYFGNQGA